MKYEVYIQAATNTTRVDVDAFRVLHSGLIVDFLNEAGESVLTVGTHNLLYYKKVPVAKTEPVFGSQEQMLQFKSIFGQG